MWMLEHLLDEGVNLVLAVTRLATLAEALALLGLTTLGWAELEWPQEVVGLLEVGTHSVNLVHKILHADDAVLAECGLDDRVVVEWETLLVDLAESTLVDQLANRLKVRVSVRQVWLHTLQHLSGGLGHLHENTHVHLAKTHDLEDLLGLRVHVVETTNTHDKCELGLSIHKVVASSLGLTVHSHTLLGHVAVLLHVLLCRFVHGNTLVLVPCVRHRLLLPY